MSPLITTKAGASAGAYGWGAAASGPIASFESITSASGTGSSGTITFSSIPSTYTHLQVRGIFQDSLGYSIIKIQLNGDTASNYSWHRLYGEPGSSASGQASGAATQTSISPGPNGGPTGTTEMGVAVIDLLDYASTSKNKTIRFFGGVASTNSSYNYIAVSSGLWQSTSAINSVTLFVSGANWTTTTTFALYGIKAAA